MKNINNLLIPYRKGKLFGYSDYNGKLIIPVQFDTAERFVDGYAQVSIDCRYGMMFKNCQIAIPLEYEMIGFSFSDGLIKVEKNNLWGFINKGNNLKIDYQFEQALGFNEGLASVKQNGKWGYINTSGKFVITPKYDWAMNFEDGVAEVQLDTWVGYINKSGREYF